MNQIAVIVTCHAPYLRWLPEALQSIDSQVPLPAERVLVCDGCHPPSSAPGWQQISGKWNNPASARNAGIAATQANWLIFWDADNVMPPSYIAAAQRAISAAPSDLAVIYPDIQLLR